MNACRRSFPVADRREQKEEPHTPVWLFTSLPLQRQSSCLKHVLACIGPNNAPTACFHIYCMHGCPVRDSTWFHINAVASALKFLQ